MRTRTKKVLVRMNKRYRARVLKLMGWHRRWTEQAGGLLVLRRGVKAVCLTGWTEFKLAK